MEVTEEALLESGFRARELQIIKNHNASFDETLEEAIQDLARRFRVMFWILLGCLTLFILVSIFNDKSHIISTGITLLIVMPLTAFIQPPRLAYKSWRYWRKQRTNSDSAPR